MTFRVRSIDLFVCKCFFPSTTWSLQQKLTEACICRLQSPGQACALLAARFFAREKEDCSPCLTPFSTGVQAPSPVPVEQSCSGSLLGRHSPSLQLKLISCVGLLETMNKYSISTVTFFDINEVTWPEAETSDVYWKCYL